MHPPARRDPGELPAPGSAHEVLHPGGRLAHLAARQSKAHPGHHGYVGVARALHQVYGSLGRAPCVIELASLRVDVGGDGEHPRRHVVVRGDLGSLERLVLQRCRRGQVPAAPS